MIVSLYIYIFINDVIITCNIPAYTSIYDDDDNDDGWLLVYAW